MPHGKNKLTLPPPSHFLNNVMEIEDIKKILKNCWQAVLGVDHVGGQDNFYELGGTSVNILQAQQAINSALGIYVKVTDLFTYPSIDELAGYITGTRHTSDTCQDKVESNYSNADREVDVAIIGYAGSFSDSDTIHTYWKKVLFGKECTSRLPKEDCLRLGVPKDVVSNQSYVPVGGFVPDIDKFDAGFWGLSPKDAALMDPQTRLFLENAWKALEMSGYIRDRSKLAISVFAGGGGNQYLWDNLYHNKKIMHSMDKLEVYFLGCKDFLAARTSYLLDLHGPVINIYTGCSTSLVAVIEACKQLAQGTCQLAIAGGVNVILPQNFGYVYKEGMISSPDGYIRSFDKDAKGMVLTSGVGTVILKRLSEAQRDNDNIISIIKGYGINNDGRRRVSFAAPSVLGQKECILEAQRSASISSDAVSYVECHGTATKLGDPIEVKALHDAFNENTEDTRTSKCVIGSVKANIGHPDTAAGVAGLIKVCHMLQEKVIPPQIHFQTPNPKLELDTTPFEVVTEKREWTTQEGTPRIAGISSFGVGGTNAHVILEEAPNRHKEPKIERPYYLLSLSAKSSGALDRGKKELANHLASHPEEDLADVAYTLHTSREEFNHRQMYVCKDISEAIKALEGSEGTTLKITKEAPPSVIFLCSGVGEHYVDMGKDLYETLPFYKEQVDQCCAILDPLLEKDLRDILFNHSGLFTPHEREELLNRTEYLQSAVFVMGYATAMYWMKSGVYPRTLIGHSTGEYLAACLSGVLSLEDALRLLVKRAQIIHALPEGAMLAVPLKEKELDTYLSQKGVSLGAVNGPSLCVLSGETQSIKNVKEALAKENLTSIDLPVTHAFHSKMLESAQDELLTLFKSVTYNDPTIPYISNLTGHYVTPEDVKNPEYWYRHTCEPVRFSEGILSLLKETTREDRVFIEVGPGRNLVSAVLQHQTKDTNLRGKVLNSLRNITQDGHDYEWLLSTFGKAWLQGVRIEWDALYSHSPHYRVPLPTYSFEKSRYWVDADRDVINKVELLEDSNQKLPIEDWFHKPVWKKDPLIQSCRKEQYKTYLIFADECGLGDNIAKRLRINGNRVSTVVAGRTYTYNQEANIYTIAPHKKEDYIKLWTSLTQRKLRPSDILHLWLTNDVEKDHFVTAESIHFYQERGFLSLLYLTQSLTEKEKVNESVKISVLGNGIHSVLGNEELYPEKATIQGLVSCIPQEFFNIRTQYTDIEFKHEDIEKTARDICHEVFSDTGDTQVAYRNHERWALSYEKLTIPENNTPPILKQNGTYLITGGLGEIGLSFAEYLAKSVSANLVLVGRSEFPAREEWDHWITTHDTDDVTRKKILRLQKIENLGGTVLALQADVSDKNQIHVALEKTKKIFGKINGLFHLAGTTKDNKFTYLRDTQSSHLDSHIKPKGPSLCVLRDTISTLCPDIDFVFSHRH